MPEGGLRGRKTQLVDAAPALIPPIPATQESFKFDHPLLNGTVAVETINNRISKLYALIIGINDYPNLPKLKGAVADANEIEKFLTSESELKVPPSQIINLRDKDATRQNIIDSIKVLQNNSSINHGDPILIYYAGHGGARKATEEWKKAKGAHLVQVIFPFDYDAKVDDSSNPVECIPDRTIAGLLNELAAAKGDNITVIFDSCHSAAGTRDPINAKQGVLDRRERSAEVKRDIPWDIDSDIVRPEVGIAPPPAKDDIRHTKLPLCVNQTSHIHLAACGSEEKAWEEDGRGVFTMALLKSIRANGVDKISYYNLIKSLPSLSSQSPHCYGKHKARILFNSGVPSRSALMIPVEVEEGSKKIILQAGAASGVTTKSIWEIYDSASGNVLLGKFRAEPPLVSTTVLQYEGKGEDGAYWAHIERAKSESSETRTYARQVRVGVIDELRVYFTPRAKERIFAAGEVDQTEPYSIGSGEHDVGYVVHGAEDSADIAVDLDSELVSFRLCDRQAEQYEVAKLVKKVRAERSAVEEVLFGAAKWKWHLQRKNIESADMVTMELIRMGERSGRTRVMWAEEDRKSMTASGVSHFEVRRENLYGIKLTSRVEKPVHVRMCYFDTTDFSIVDMFGHQTGKDPVMAAKGTFIIGNNYKGGSPLQFMLNEDEGEKLDLGYMKVFWSTEPLEMEQLGQKPTFNRKSRSWSQRHRGASLDVDENIEWGTALLTLVQRLPDVNN
ncbi:caspase domain-containing protein [Rhizoctonia solani]|nr:caspase domain-containing protein [Rhizoctonia solani]